MNFDFSKLVSNLKQNLQPKGGGSILGIDFGSSSIKIVQIHSNDGVPTLDTYGEIQLGPYAGVEVGRTTNLPAGKLIESFVDIVREAAVTTKSAALSIPYASSFTTVITLSGVSGEQINARVPVEARKYVPAALSEVEIDWFPIEEDVKNQKTKILLAAIYKDALEKYQMVMRKAELSVQFTEIEMFAAIRASASATDKAIALIDCGASASKLYIVSGGIVERTHRVGMGGNELTLAVAETLHIEFDHAEAQKRTSGLYEAVEGDGESQRAMRRILERGCREMHQVMTRYSQSEGKTIEKVILCGGGALLRGIDVYTQDILQTPVTIADPFAKLAYPAYLEDTLKAVGSTFAVSVGAALRLLS